jgi:hypothetical protein
MMLKGFEFTMFETVLIVALMTIHDEVFAFYILSLVFKYLWCYC